jgi:hypothetical protein
MVSLLKNSFRGGIVDDSLSARVGLPKYNESCKNITNFILQPQGGVYRRPGLRFVAEPAADGTPTGAGVQPTLVPFVYNSQISYIVALLELKYKVYGDQAFIDEDNSFFTEEENKTADYAQSADTLYLVHKDRTAFKILRTSPTTFPNALLGFGTNFPTPSTFAPVFVGPPGTFTIEYAMTAVTDSGQESLPTFANVTNGRNSMQWQSSNWATATWTAVPGADSYNIYKKKQGIYGFIGNVRGAGPFTNVIIDLNYDPIITDSVPEAYNPFIAGDPGVVSLFQQRLWFSGREDTPQTIYASRVGDFENLNFSPFIRPDDSIENTIYSGIPDGVQWIVVFNKALYVGTVAKVHKLSSATGGAVTPSDINIDAIVDWGASKIKPAVAGNSLLYVEEKSSKIRDVFERQQNLGITGNDRSVNAPDLFEGFEIVSMAFQRTPDPILWCVRDDGKVVALTYLLNEDLWGWHLHETDGLFKNVAVIPGAVYDEVYFTVYRNGQYNIEMLEDKWDGLDIEDAKFLDGMITKEDVVKFFVVAGLDHLEGKTVRAFVDGELLSDSFVVSGGLITLPALANKAHVGLPYTSTLAPLSSEFSTNQGTTLGKTKSISEVKLRLKNSQGGKIGPLTTRLDALVKKDVDYGNSSNFTGDVKAVFPKDYNADSSFFIVQDEPLPMTVSALFIEIDSGRR